MQRVVSAEEMRWCDEVTIKKLGIPGLLLMENAGAGVARFIQEHYGPLRDKSIVIICGKGNNGGDGFVAARHLSQTDASIRVMLFASPNDLAGDAKTNFDLLKSVARLEGKRVAVQRGSVQSLRKLRDVQIVVDALFGTGFSGKVRRPFLQVIEWMNEQKCPRVAVDVPSGVDGTTGEVRNAAVVADATVTFGLLKSGLLCSRGRELSGCVEVVPIGIPKSVTQSKSLRTYLVESADVRRVLPRRSVHAHKYSVGKIFVLAGSKGLTGAASMASLSAMRVGAGAVVLGTPELVAPILARKLTEVMVNPLPATADGTLSLKALDAIREKLSWADVLVLGPGLSQNAETQALVIRLLSTYAGKILLDADGLNALANAGANLLKKCAAEIILTPHVGECGRLTGLSSSEIESRRIDVAREFARTMKNVVVLKGVPTVTATADGDAYLNSTGNPGMATAGAGDVLSGTIAGLWAQGMSAAEAAYAGVFIHGLAGDLAAEEVGQRSLLAGDLIEHLPETILQVESEGVR